MENVIQNTVWNDVCSDIINTTTVNKNKFNAVRGVLIPQIISDNFILFSTNSDFNKRWIYSEFSITILNSLKKITGRDYDIEIEVDNVVPTQNVKVQQNIDNSNNSINTDNNQTQSQNTQMFESYVDENLSFQNFVPGDSNRIAWSQSLFVAENPKQNTFNPLFIYGKSGLGKTHLLMSIYNEIKMTYADLNVIYMDTNQFINEYTKAATEHNIKKESFQTFHERFNESDVLLLDDVQYLQGKKATLEVIFQIFNKLISQGKQIVLSADRSPKNIDLGDERYNSRFSSGSVCQISPPEIETKVALINKFFEECNKNFPTNNLINFSDEVISYIAENTGSNIRELKGTIKTIFLKSVNQSETLTITEIDTILKDNFSDIKLSKLTAEDIQRTVEKYFNITHADLIGKTRKSDIKHARQIATYLIRTILELSTTEIGNKFNQDHSTILYSIKKIENDLKTNNNTKEEIEALRILIKEL